MLSGQYYLIQNVRAMRKKILYKISNSRCPRNAQLRKFKIIFADRPRINCICADDQIFHYFFCQHGSDSARHPQRDREATTPGQQRMLHVQHMWLKRWSLCGCLAEAGAVKGNVCNIIGKKKNEGTIIEKWSQRGAEGNKM